MLCDQLDNIAFPGCGVPTVPASSIHCVPWTVVIESNLPLGLDVLIQATASLFLLLDLSIVREHDFLGAHANHTEAVMHIDISFH